MGLWGRLFGRPTEPTKSVDLSPEIWAALNGGWGLPTKSGAKVSARGALQVTPYYRAILVIAEGIAQLPVEIYRRSGRGVEPAIDHPLYEVLRFRANGLQDSFQFFRTLLMHAAGAGNGVAYRVIVAGQLRELIPVRPECVTIDVDRFFRRTYSVTLEQGDFAVLTQEDVFHVAGPSWSPVNGIDPAVIGREAIGLALRTEETHARLHSNGTRPSGVLEAPKEARIGEPEIARLRETWRQTYSGTSKVGETPILSGGLQWKQIAMSGVDAEHLDTRKHQIEEIARLLGVFPIMLGHAGDQTPTFASADAFLEAHVRYTLQPWIKAVAAAIEMQLLTKEERDAGYHCRIDTSELLRGSLQDRTEYYRAALGDSQRPGWLTQDEVREDDGWNPIADRDLLQSPPQPSDDRAPDVGLKSSTPRPLYVSRKLLNADVFLRWAREQGFRTTLAASDLHVTIAFSRTPVDWMMIDESWSSDGKGTLLVPPGGPRVVERLGERGAVVLKFKSSALQWRHEAIREAGASWDHPEYQPHVTITYEDAPADLTQIEPYRGELRFGPEIFEDLIEDRGSKE